MTKRIPMYAVGALGALVAFSTSSCATDGDDDDGNKPSDQAKGPEGTPIDWDPSGTPGECNLDALLQVHSYAAKVKALLTGLPLSDAELLALQENPEALADFVDGWQSSPEAVGILRRFFETSFQQNGFEPDTKDYLLGRATGSFGRFSDPTSPFSEVLLSENLMESFARTAIQMVEDERPFNEVATTDTFMMTTAVAMITAYLDGDIADDEGNFTFRNTPELDQITFVSTAGAAPPMSQALNPGSANFMKFFHSDLADLPASCDAASVTITGNGAGTGNWRIGGKQAEPPWALLQILMGRPGSINKSGSAECNTGTADVAEPVLLREDFTDWHMVKIRPPAAGEEPTRFYDLAALRAADELVLNMPRRGFLSTPGFHGTWPNNEDNSARVSINQTLIVALGKSFEGDTVSDFSPTNLDAEHAPPDSECYGCHQTLDPMRDFMRASFTNSGHQQLDPERSGLVADFVFDGEETSGTGIEDLTQILADHPAFPYAWAHKLCFYANAAPCPTGAELDRIVEAFVADNLNFRTLVRELFTSPIVTGSKCIVGVNSGTEPIISRRTLFCSSLSSRLETDDICGLSQLEVLSNFQKSMSAAVTSIPDDAFSRSVVEPVVISETGLFTRANREAACVLVAEGTFYNVFSEVLADDALDEMVEIIMGLPPADPRHDEARVILQSHFDEALEASEDEVTALKSAMALACMAPGSAGVGF